jgi:hypothetical protein
MDRELNLKIALAIDPVRYRLTSSEALALERRVQEAVHTWEGRFRKLLLERVNYEIGIMFDDT